MGLYEFVELEGTWALTRKARCAHEDLASVVQDLFEGVMEQYPEAELTAPPRLYYQEWNPGDCLVEVACPVEEGQARDQDGGQFLRACTCFYTEHVGPLEGLADAWMAMWAEAQQRGISSSGPPFDEYVTDPNEEPDPAKFVTALHIPI